MPLGPTVADAIVVLAPVVGLIAVVLVFGRAVGSRLDRVARALEANNELLRGRMEQERAAPAMPRCLVFLQNVELYPPFVGPQGRRHPGLVVVDLLNAGIHPIRVERMTFDPEGHQLLTELGGRVALPSSDSRQYQGTVETAAVDARQLTLWFTDILGYEWRVNADLGQATIVMPSSDDETGPLPASSAEDVLPSGETSQDDEAGGAEGA